MWIFITNLHNTRKMLLSQHEFMRIYHFSNTIVFSGLLCFFSCFQLNKPLYLPLVSLYLAITHLFGIMQLYIEGYLQAMLDMVYKQEYLRVRVIDNQVILPCYLICIISIRISKVPFII